MRYPAGRSRPTVTPKWLFGTAPWRLTSYSESPRTLIQSDAPAADELGMQNHGRHKYIQRGWWHRWTPLATQQASTRRQPPRCSTNQQRQSGKIIFGGFAPDGAHCDFLQPARDGFRGRDCIG